jgi:dipeptidyl aminopeptidase/acylaminoacyl peptidase
MDALSARVRRPEPPLAAGISLVLTGLVAAIVLGNTLTGPADSSPRPGVTERPGSTDTPVPTLTATPAPTASGSASFVLGPVADSTGWKPVAWSPDGSMLLVRRDDAWGVLDEGGQIESIESESASWWPGADRTLGLVVRDPDGQVSLELRPTDGGETQTLVRQPDISAVAWSPDGETVAIATPAGVLVGSVHGQLSPAATAASAVTISPDGSQVAYVVAAGADAGSLVLLDLGPKQARTAGAIRMLTRDALAWAPNGRFIALTGSSSSRRGLYLIAPTVAQSAVFVLDGADPASIRWSPDGRFLAASHSVGTDSELVSIRVRPDLARLERLGPGGATAWSLDSQTLLTVDSTGRLLAYPIRAAASVDSSSSPSPSPPRVLATDADPTCAPASSADGLVAYCDRANQLVLTR